MIRVGIITMYHNSVNYGGVLQAYALTEILNEIGFDAVQIDYDFWPEFNSPNNSIKRMIKNVIEGFYLKRRRKEFSSFRMHIPHTENTYTLEDIYKCNDIFDVFITGSDQVWNMDGFHEPFFLTFVEESKKKISYAAGMGTEKITEDTKERYKNLLHGYNAISVREIESVDILGPLVNKEVAVSLDPTLLLDTKTWDKVSSSRLYNKGYVFAYLIGNDQIARNLVMAFAKEKKLQVVTIPHVNGYSKMDQNFGDKKMYDASPADFISLIKHAEYVFTDSFHCCVFSSLYHKDYYVFERTGKRGMSSRIENITALFNAQTHFLQDDKNRELEYVLSLKPIQYDEKSYLEAKEKSIEYLRRNVNTD